MSEISILIGGQAGDGIKQSGNIIARLLNRYGYFIFVYEDYPSLIRGGHNFAIVRASEKKIFSHENKIDILIALNQETFEKHRQKLTEDSTIIFDSDKIQIKENLNKIGVPMTKTVRDKGLPQIARNNIAFGVLAGVINSDFEKVQDIIKATIKKESEKNIEIARTGFETGKKFKSKLKIKTNSESPKPLLTGNEAIALGLVKGGMKLYVAYPMTPSSSILHYLANNEETLGIRTVHPETEIAVIGIAEGAAYAGLKSAVGTSGGGFALMVEHLSLAGQAEIPIVIVLAQRPGPATGVPTYTEQGDLFFSIFAGHGEFPRVVIAPGDIEEAFYLSQEAMNIAWRFQIPVIILSDKHLSESTFSFTVKEHKTKNETPLLWDRKGEYKRYLYTEKGISPLAFPGTPGAIVKLNSYEHDEYGITTEEPEIVLKGHEKRLRKIETIKENLKNTETVKVYGNRDSRNCIITWGSTKGPVCEIAEDMGLKVIQPLYMHPLPDESIKEKLKNCKKIISVEVNSTAQFATWLSYHGIKVDEKILRYDGRPFTPQELEEKVKEVLK